MIEKIVRKSLNICSGINKKRKTKKSIDKYSGKGAELEDYLRGAFGVEKIFFFPAKTFERGISFPSACEFDEKSIATTKEKWILIHNDTLNERSKTAVYRHNGMSVSIADLIALYENIKPGEIPMVVNEIGNIYPKVIVCGLSKNATAVYHYLNSNSHAQVVQISPKKLEGIVRTDGDSIILVCDLLPNLFSLLRIPQNKNIQWQNIANGNAIMDEANDIVECIIPKLRTSGVEVVCVYVPIITEMPQKYGLMLTSAPWKLCRSVNFSRYIKKTYRHFHTEELTVEHLDVKAKRDRGFVEKYHNGSLINYDNGQRRTIGNKASYTRRILLFGPCLVMGAYVSDADTIPSIMQKILGEDYLLLNRGQPKEIGLNLLMRSTEYQKGDIVLYFGSSPILKKYDGVYYNLKDSYIKINRLRSHITDCLAHCDAYVNRLIANDLVKVLKSSDCLLKPMDTSCDSRIVFGPEIKAIPDIKMLKNPQFEEYIASIRPYAKEGRNGAIVMNCNPFTNGHLYLITEAAKRVDTLYIFVVEEDRSFFPFNDRIELVKQGTSHLGNVCVLNSGSFVISSTTLPGYFEKDQVGDIYLDASNDMMLFLQITKAMNISVRFAGSEPIDKFTAQYNINMRKYLVRYGVEFEEIERKKNADGFISASVVRKYLKEKNFESIKDIVPETTYQYLLKKYG